MKKIIIIILVALCSSTLFGQITLDTTMNLNIIKLEKSGYKLYFYDNTTDTLMLYNLDYSLYKIITIPAQSNIQGYMLNYITEVLFNTDSNDIEYMMTGFLSGSKWTKIYDENLNLLFFADSAGITWTTNPDANRASSPIVNTDQGTKMFLVYGSKFNIYSLPGHLECDFCSGTSSMLTANEPHYVVPANTLAAPFPNPSGDVVTIPYSLPNGTSTGEIVIYDVQGNKIKSYKVGNNFTSLKISNSNLSSGTYYYTLTTDKGIIGGRKMIIVK